MLRSSRFRLWMVSGAVLLGASGASAASSSDFLRSAESAYRSGQYLQSARYAFSANEEDSGLRPEAYSWITLSLMRAGLPNSASYFFIRTLQSGNKAAIRRVLGETEALLVHVGGDLLRKYLIRHTSYGDYNPQNRSAYLYSLGKEALLSGKEESAVGYFNGIQRGTGLWPVVLQLRASAYALQGKNELAVQDFRECQRRADDLAGGREPRESDDLRARCLAGEARTLYAMDRFDDADRAYDRISKMSIVWPDVLFEQAWNSFARKEYNRTLGKLVSYKSPALKFVFNPEVDVLRSQSYLAMCLYSDANDVVNEFNANYTRVGEEVKRFVEKNSLNLMAFHELGRKAVQAPLYTQSDLYRMMNRFVRSPYFRNLLKAEREISAELVSLRRQGTGGGGFSGFAEQVLQWRLRTIQLLGGVFVKNSLLDYHSALISDFEKMAFIKLEMLKQAKDRLQVRNASTKDGERERGDVEPSRRSYQYYWSFNGEFWNDELGDYVFGLESECGKGDRDQ
ncbi:MAG: hypothetical protein A2X94_08960 [Bdellovibrionales bacterium GWB1_55_8]|nr:MAG: hypothetical protein A2X94_08960 [Bdellovibrionales bacterium GWB1_55_8]